MIGLFACHVPAMLDQMDIAGLCDAIEPTRAATIMRFENVMDQARSAAGEVLFRFVATALMTENPGMLNVPVDALGNPHLPEKPTFCFNLSQSGDWVVLGTDSQPLGVDVESVNKFDVGGALSLFSPQDHQYVSQQSSGSAARTMCEMWTLRESYVKALGIGWQVMPDSFSVVPFNKMKRTIEGALKGYYFRQFWLDPTYLVAVCAQSNEFPPQIETVNPEYLAMYVRKVTNQRTTYNFL